MWWEFAIYIVVALVALYLVIFQRDFVRKYWKYLLAVLPLIIIAVRIIAVIVSRRQGDTTAARDLQGAIGNVRDDIEAANMEAAIRTAAARAKDQAKIDELKEVLAVKDRAERRNRLAQLVG
jgi:hypothetical protein